MKYLYKIADKRNAIPILTMIQVKNGIAYASNADIFITCACDKPDGFYRADKAKIGIWGNDPDFKDGDHAQFYLPDNHDHYEKINANDLAWLKDCVPKDDARYYLNGVFFGPEFIAATDGRHLKKINSPSRAQTFIMPRELVEILASMGGEFNLYAYKNGMLKIENPEYTIISRTIDGTFPDIARVIPTDRTTGVPFDSEVFKKSFKRIKELSKLYDSKNYPIKICENGDILCFNEKLGETGRPPFDIGFNGKYLAESDIEGLAYYGENERQSLMVINGGKTFVCAFTCIP